MLALPLRVVVSGNQVEGVELIAAGSATPAGISESEMTLHSGVPFGLRFWVPRLMGVVLLVPLGVGVLGSLG